jgi:hypothetical protein
VRPLDAAGREMSRLHKHTLSTLDYIAVREDEIRMLERALFDALNRRDRGDGSTHEVNRIRRMLAYRQRQVRAA